MDLSSASGMQRFINRFGSDGAPMFAISLEIKILSVLVMLFLFLLFLIVVLWDRYGKEIGELYTPSAANKGDANGSASLYVCLVMRRICGRRTANLCVMMPHLLLVQPK